MKTVDRAMDSRQYEIVASESKVGVPQIKVGEDFVHFAEFRMPPENQLRMVELAKQHIGPAMSLEGLASATFHRSLDGARRHQALCSGSQSARPEPLIWDGFKSQAD